jgi:hypothetical protein
MPRRKNQGGSVQNPCEGCLHWYGAYGWGNCCNYIFDVGHRRPCEPGEHCTVKRIATEEERKALRASWDLL